MGRRPRCGTRLSHHPKPEACRAPPGRAPAPNPRGSSSTSNAGIAVSVHSMQNKIPTAAKIPNARTGASGEMANERNPIAVVIAVATTGKLISSNAAPTASAAGRPCRAARCCR